MDESNGALSEPQAVAVQAAKTKPVGDIATDVYAAAAECLDAVLKQRASVNSAIFKSPFPQKPFLLAITQKTLDNLDHLKRIIFKSQVLELEPRLTKNMAYVIAYDMLFGEMRKPNGIARLMTKHSEPLKMALQKYMVEMGVKDKAQLKTQITKYSTTPRYVRVNRLKTTTEEVIASLTGEGFSLVEYEADVVSQHTYLKMLAHFRPTSFFRDFHMPNMLVFHPTVNFHKHQLETSGKIALQDKASCLPSLLLNPPPGSTVIDACAAPGMKTSHLAALMENNGKIFAIDINEERCKTMDSMLKHFGATCCEVVHEDFLKISPDDEKYSGATHILVDPTCTGSGVTGKLQNAKKGSKKSRKKTEDDKKRLQKLKSLQVSLLKHALSFPSVERVVYSTCSINPEEDEEVVQEALKAFASDFVVRPYSKYLPKWKGSGKPRYSCGSHCLRAFQEKHRTNGFFVAVIERFTAADAEAAQNANGEVAKETDSVVDKVKDEPETNGVSADLAESGGKSRRKRKNRHHDAATEVWSASAEVKAKKPPRKKKKAQYWSAAEDAAVNGKQKKTK